MKKQKDERLPLWAKTALQGLAFWIGYKRALYREYPLSEGALISELRSLIQANLPDDLFLKCEITYNKLARSIAGRTRADIVVANKIEKQKGRFVYGPTFVMEFKRALAPTREINKDFHRLAARDIYRLTRARIMRARVRR
jgi:hypothetical protein